MNGDILWNFDDAMLTVDDEEIDINEFITIDSECLKSKEYKNERNYSFDAVKPIRMEVKIKKFNRFRVLYGWRYVKNYIKYWFKML